MRKQPKTIPKKIKDKLLVEAMHRCCLCPEHRIITEIHHIVPISEEGPNTEDNLMVVCPTCHAKIERIKSMYTPKQLKMYKEKWVNLCWERKLPIEECIKSAPGILIFSFHNQTPPEPNFVGREDMLETITKWYESPDVKIGTLIGWGGFGKSALARKWYDSLKENNIQPDGIFWWGFYRNPYLDRFLEELLRYLAQGRVDLSEVKTSWQKAERIKEFITEREYLIILDGLEVMQKEEKEEFGAMKDRDFQEILRYIPDSNFKGLCLITTRFQLTDIERHPSYKKLDIEELSKEDTKLLFKKVGVKGTEEEIETVWREFGGHTLSLVLLANYLGAGGDIKKAKEIPPFTSDKEARGKAHKILLWYDKQLDENRRQFMKIFSLFRQSVGEEEFDEVFLPRIEMEPFHFKLMVDDLCQRRLISKHSEFRLMTLDSQTLHIPLIP